MHRHNSSVLQAFVPACVLAVTLSLSTATPAQSWVWAEHDLWRWTTGEAEWMPDDSMLTEAEQRLEIAFRTAAEAALPRSTLNWEDYTLEYQGRTIGSAKVIRIVGDCDFDSRTVPLPDGASERVVVTGGGDTCLFNATYDTNLREVTDFRFNGRF